MRWDGGEPLISREFHICNVISVSLQIEKIHCLYFMKLIESFYAQRSFSPPVLQVIFITPACV